MAHRCRQPSPQRAGAPPHRAVRPENGWWRDKNAPTHHMRSADGKSPAPIADKGGGLF